MNDVVFPEASVQPFFRHDDVALRLALLLVGVSSCFLAWPWFRRYLERKKPFDSLPMPPGCHWLVGQVVQMSGEQFRVTHDRLMKQPADKNGRTGFWIMKMPTISLLHWEDAKTVLTSQHHRPSIPFISHHFNKSFGKKLLLLLNGKEWKTHRSFVHRAFGPTTVEGYRQIMVDTIDNAVGSLSRKLQENESNNNIMDIKNLMKMIAMDVFGKAAMSINLESCQHLRLSPFAEAFDFLIEDITRRLGNPLNPLNHFYGFPINANRKHAEQRAFVQSFLADVIAKRRGGDNDTTKYNDILSDLLGKTADGGDEIKDNLELSEEVLQELLMMLLFAGYDTTSISLAYTLYLLSQHPDVEEACVKEIRSTNVTNSDGLVFCWAVIMESLRLYPPAPVTSRGAQKSIKLSDGFVIPEGTFVLLPIHLIQRHEKNFAAPDEFRPDRWAKYDEASRRWVKREYNEKDDETAAGSIPPGNPNAFLAFSTGGRNCPGSKFAVQEAVLVLSRLLPEFRFKATPGYKLQPIRKGPVQHPKGGVPMIIERRKPVAK